MSDKLDLLQGTLDLLILKAVSLGPLHGYGVLLRIQQISSERLEIQQGSLYPALYRLEAAGMVKGEWEDGASPRRGPRRRTYRLTQKGRRRLNEARGEFHQFAAVIGGILGTAV